MTNAASNERSEPDRLLTDIAEYAVAATVDSDLAHTTAHQTLLDAVGCGLLALRHPECVRVLGPVVPGTTVPYGVAVPGTGDVLDPVKAAFDIGAMVRWLDYNDTWLAAEWGHPSDNVGAILAAAAYRCAREPGALSMRDVLTATVKAHEIQGVLALANSFNAVGLDHVLLVRVASTAVATALLGGTVEQVRDAVSQAWVDGGALRVYRHAPNAGPRKSWAAGDATSRGVRLALLTLAGEPGYATPLSAPTWGFSDVLLRGAPVTRPREFGSYVIENVLFKISYPAEFHAQTALEAAVALSPEVAGRLDDVDRIELTTHESAIRIISKTGPLHNPADRDHCLQYIVAIGLIHGTLTAEHYSDAAAADPRIDALRERMTVVEDPRYSADYLDPGKRSIANAVRVVFRDGTATRRVEVEYPIGHRVRRDEGIPLLWAKFEANVRHRYPAPGAADRIVAAVRDRTAFEALPVPDFLALFPAPDRAA